MERPSAPCGEGVFTSSAGIPLRFIREGTGPALMIFGSAAYYSREFSRGLRDHFHLVFTDLRHFVPTYEPSAREIAEMSLDTFADEVEEVRAAMGLDRIALLGHSAHAQIAVAYAQKHAAHLSTVILVGGVPFRFDELAPMQQRQWEEHASRERKAILAERLAGVERELKTALTSRAFAIQYHANGPLYWADPTHDDRQQLACLETSHAFDALFRSIPSRAEARRRLESLEVPTLVIAGRLDFAIPHLAWQELVAGLPHVTYRCILESGHNPHREHPAVFDQILVEWFQGM